MKFKLEIDCGNAAFGDDDYSRAAQIVRILEDLVIDLRDEAASVGTRYTLRDFNGNKVGFAETTDA